MALVVFDGNAAFANEQGVVVSVLCDDGIWRYPHDQGVERISVVEYDGMGGVVEVGCFYSFQYSRRNQGYTRVLGYDSHNTGNSMLEYFGLPKESEGVNW